MASPDETFVRLVWGRTGRHHHLVGKYADGSGRMLASVIWHGRRHGWWFACAHGPTGYRSSKETAMRVAHREAAREARRHGELS